MKIFYKLQIKRKRRQRNENGQTNTKRKTNNFFPPLRLNFTFMSFRDTHKNKKKLKMKKKGR